MCVHEANEFLDRFPLRPIWLKIVISEEGNKAFVDDVAGYLLEY